VLCGLTFGYFKTAVWYPKRPVLKEPVLKPKKALSGLTFGYFKTAVWYPKRPVLKEPVLKPKKALSGTKVPLIATPTVDNLERSGSFPQSSHGQSYD
jgi:hypothetical protein